MEESRYAGEGTAMVYRVERIDPATVLSVISPLFTLYLIFPRVYRRDEEPIENCRLEEA